MRIAHVIPEFRIGGQERVALDLARTHAAEGHEVTAFSLVGIPDGGTFRGAFEAAGIPAITVAKLRGLDPTTVVRLAGHLLLRRVDVVHTHNPMAMTYGAPAGKLVGAVVVHTKHGENPDTARRVKLRRAVGHLTDAFVAVSSLTAQSARDSRDVDPGKLRVIANGIDLHRFVPDPALRLDARRELGIPEGAWVIGTVGRVAPEKNHVLLVRAAAGLLGQDVRLIIVGDGSEVPKVRAAVEECGLGEWVHLAGPRQDVGRLMSAFDVFALPSLTEGLPLVLPEAMASGLPLIASAVGGVPDVVQEGVTGLLVPPGDLAALRAALQRTIDDREWARQLGRTAREQALTRFSLERMAADYMSLYLDLLTRKGRRRA